MSHCDRLILNYRRFVSLPWSNHLAGKERVWFAVYPPSEERRVRAHLQEFQMATLDAGHKWIMLDLADLPGKWMANHPHHDEYFQAPEALITIEEDIQAHVVESIKEILLQSESDANAVVALTGVGALFGYIHVSPVIAAVEDDVKGRLLVFFPGEYERNLYRFMDARDGFNYMAVPITSQESALPS
jgi:hypothetical protein